MNYDPDQASIKYLQTLESYLAAPLKKANDLILNPKGASQASIEWNRNRQISIQAQIEGEFTAVRRQIADYTGKAITDSSRRGWLAGQRQLQSMKWQLNRDPLLNASFSGFNMDTARAIALATFRDADRAMGTTRKRIETTMRKMADNGLTAADVNALMAGRVIEGKPSALIGDLRKELEAIHGERITFPSGRTMEVAGKNGYARMLARTRLREAAVNGRHQRLITDGVDHVVIIGNVTMYPCTAYLGKIYYIGSGNSPGNYPGIDSIDGPPFHPNCSKTTAPIVIELADPAILDAGQPDETTRKMAEAGVNSSAGVTIMKGDFVKQQAAETQKRITSSIREAARAAGYNPPPWSPSVKGKR